MKKILMIDDEKDFCFFLKKNLEAAGDFQVTVSNSGAEGIKAALVLHPDIILLDFIMPGMDGSEVAEKLQSQPQTKNIPIIFLTAIVDEQEARQHQHVIGGWHCVAKPVKIDELLQLINTVIK